MLNKKKLERVLGYMLDEDEFLGPYGIRSLSRYHLEHPFTSTLAARSSRSQYLPGRIGHRHVRRQLELARAGLDAGQRADRPGAAEPVQLLRRRIQGRVPDRLGQLHDAVRGGPGDHRGAWPASSCATQQRASGRSTAGSTKFQDDPHWRDQILFYEYFHGDNGAGLGASHQTGWTGLIARLMDIFGRMDAKDIELALGQVSARLVVEQVGGD